MRRPWCRATLLLLMLAFVACVPIRSNQKLREFGILWNTTDAIQVYIDQNHKWPQDWDALSSALIACHARSSYLRDSVVVNFAVDCEKTPQPGDWYLSEGRGRRGMRNRVTVTSISVAPSGP